jgi:hypothetical protein
VRFDQRERRTEHVEGDRLEMSTSNLINGRDADCTGTRPCALGHLPPHSYASRLRNDAYQQRALMATLLLYM